jgi:hypothetical protein
LTGSQADAFAAEPRSKVTFEIESLLETGETLPEPVAAQAAAR